MDKNENMGRMAKDRITGFTGMITGYCQYITGCDTYLIVPKAKEANEYPEGKWMDDNRLEIFGEPYCLPKTDDDGGDMLPLIK